MDNAYYWRKLRESELNNFDELLLKDISYLEEHYNSYPNYLEVSAELYFILRHRYKMPFNYATNTYTYQDMQVIINHKFKGYSYKLTTKLGFPKWAFKLD